MGPKRSLKNMAVGFSIGFAVANAWGIDPDWNGDPANGAVQAAAQGAAENKETIQANAVEVEQDVEPADQNRPKVYLAGAWGFLDFDHDKKQTYGHYVDDVQQEKFRQGYSMLKLIEQDIGGAGYKTINPWTDTIDDAFIDGVMFGAGKNLAGKPWAEGNLKDGTLSKDSLLDWISQVAADKRVDPKKYDYSPDASSMKELEVVYRRMVGDVIYRGNRKHVEDADIVFVNLNKYRGDADDGSLWECLHAIPRDKEVLVLVDEKPEASLGEGIFGQENRWNMMVSGYLEEHEGQVHVFHHIDEVLEYLKKRRIKAPAAGEKPRKVFLNADALPIWEKAISNLATRANNLTYSPPNEGICFPSYGKASDLYALRGEANGQFRVDRYNGKLVLYINRQSTPTVRRSSTLTVGLGYRYYGPFTILDEDQVLVKPSPDPNLAVWRGTQTTYVTDEDGYLKSYSAKRVKKTGTGEVLESIDLGELDKSLVAGSWHSKLLDWAEQLKPNNLPYFPDAWKVAPGETEKMRKEYEKLKALKGGAN